MCEKLNSEIIQTFRTIDLQSNNFQLWKLLEKLSVYRDYTFDSRPPAFHRYSPQKPY